METPGLWGNVSIGLGPGLEPQSTPSTLLPTELVLGTGACGPWVTALPWPYAVTVLLPWVLHGDWPGATQAG